MAEKKEDISRKNLLGYVQQQENKRFLGWKFYLAAYNASPRCDSCWLGKVLRKFGEAPVVLNPEQTSASVYHMEQYLHSLGYYHATVSDTVSCRNRKATVTYTVNPGSPVLIRQVNYRIQDSILRPFILADSLRSLVRPGMTLSVKLLEQERERIEQSLHNRGFYSFSHMLVSYVADTLLESNQADLSIVLNAADPPSGALDSLPAWNKRFRIRNVHIYTEYDAVEAYTNPAYMSNYEELPAVKYGPAGSISMWYRNKQNIRKGVLLNANTIEPGSYYNESEVTQTYNNFSNLRLFRVISIRFDKAAVPDGDTLIDCTIRLSPSAAQGFSINAEVSVSSLGLLGISPAISYFHRNIFRGAEMLSINFSENYQFDPFRISDRNKQSNELGASASIGLPKFFFPFFNRRFKNYSPRTEFTTSYNYQLRPEYTRNSLSFLFGYNWRTKPQFSYTVNILSINIVRLFNMSDDFYNSTLSDPYLRNRYENHFVFGSNAAFVYSTRQPSNPSNSVYLRWSVGIAGNVLSLFNSRLTKNSDNSYLVWGTPYSQYAKTDINISYHQVFNEKNTLAYRFFFGLGHAYGNSISLPYEEVYFSGGAYSLRGWQSRSVGPGAAPMDSTFTIPNQVGDLKLEANIEYRFNLSGIFEGALFLDAGNVWSLNYKKANEKAVFKASSFYRQIALNTGFGLRLNFDFLVIRFDVGAKLYEPRMYSGWVPAHNILAIDNLSLHFGIGYPF
jgi:outer membrane protein assembly factor BamA